MKYKKLILDKIKRSKKKLRKDLRNLSYLEKIKRVVEMQKLSAKLKPRSSKKWYIWSLDGEVEQLQI